MSDEATIRLQLQNVAAYRELCRSVRRSGRENVVFALIMLGFAYFIYWAGGAQNWNVALLYGVLGVGELLVGLFKWMLPSAEGLILDALVLLVFAGITFWRQFEQFQNGFGLNPVIIFLGLFMLLGALKRFSSYGDLRRLFAERPDPEHLAWFDDLVREIQVSDPHSDEFVLDLPTRPYWKAKLLGATAFFVAIDGNAVWVAGPDDFTLRREKTDRGNGRRKALLSIHGEAYPEFDIDDVSWANYTKWMATQSPANPMQ
jgi:hypothetical protein